jgi:predicted transcriptional regulator
MDTPQEIEVWLILPTIRKQLALSLKEKGMKQKEIAKSLNLTEAAVSLYLNKKRGDEVKFSKDILSEINFSATQIITKKSTVRTELQKILKSIKENKFICGVCNAHTASEKGCDICFV